MPLSAEAFRGQLQGLSREDLAAFVVDLWQARGLPAEYSDERVVLGSPLASAPKTACLVTAGGSAGVTEHVDLAVVATDSMRPEVPADVEVLCPADLYQLARYAVDADASERLLTTHFDPHAWEPSGDPGDGFRWRSRSGVVADRSSGEAASGDDSAPASGPRSVDAVPGVPAHPSGVAGRDRVAPVSDVVRAARRGASREHGGESPPDGDASGDTGRFTARGSGDSGRPTRRTILVGGGALLTGLGIVGAATLTTAEPSIDTPGLSEGGVTDPTALAGAHASAISAVSYTLRIRHIVHRADRSLRSYLSMDLALGSDRSFLTHVATAGPAAPRFLGDPPASRVYWSDGSDYLARAASEPQSAFEPFEPRGVVGTWRYWARMVPFGGTYQSNPERYLRELFEVVPTTLQRERTVDGDPVYTVVDDSRPEDGTGSPDLFGLDGVNDVQLEATVGGNGVVRSLSVGYDGDDDGERVGVHRTVEYAAVDDTRVERPDI